MYSIKNMQYMHLVHIFNMYRVIIELGFSFGYDIRLTTLFWEAVIFQILYK
jgi:hypothetical protein